MGERIGGNKMKIADRIKPIGLDSVGFLKNFRGEVTIDLKDVKTERLRHITIIT